MLSSFAFAVAFPDEYQNGSIRFNTIVDKHDSRRKGSATVRVIKRRQSGYGIAISR